MEAINLAILSLSFTGASFAYGLLVPSVRLQKQITWKRQYHHEDFIVNVAKLPFVCLSQTPEVFIYCETSIVARFMSPDFVAPLFDVTVFGRRNVGDGIAPQLRHILK